MRFSFCKNTAAIFTILLFIMVVIINSLIAWGPPVQINFLKEAISILPWFQYSICKDYKNYLMEGIVEAEYQFWFLKGGKCPGLTQNLVENKLNFVKGYQFQEEDIETAAQYFYEKFEGLKSDIRNGNRRYSEIMFELGYHLHSINNYIKPPYWHKKDTTQEEREYHSRCEKLAANTQYIQLNTKNVETITDLKAWLEKMLARNLKLRDDWHKAADEDKGNYEKYSKMACENNIYNLAGIMNYVFGDLSPGEPKATKAIEAKIYKMYKGGRKPLE